MIIVNKGADYSALGIGRAFIPEDQISSEVKAIMAHYSGSDIVKMSALQEFFDSIGSTIKGKLRNMTLPLFASTTEEAIYDIIQDKPLLSIANTNRLVLENSVKRVRATGDAPAWNTLFYDMNTGANVYTGNLIVASANGHFNYLGTNVTLNDAAVGEAKPLTQNNTKIIGLGLVSDNGALSIMRLADTSAGDRITAEPERPSWFNPQCCCFGDTAVSDITLGTRIFVSSDQLLTPDEARTIRDAVKALDDKIWGA